MIADVIFDSINSTCNKLYDREEGFLRFQIAHGYCSTTVIFFEKEHIFAKVEASGKVAFYDDGEQLLASGSQPPQEGGRERYTHIRCKVENGAIVLQLPILEWIDNYPHCDGESDRWDDKTLGYRQMRFDLLTHQISTEG